MESNHNEVIMRLREKLSSKMTDSNLRSLGHRIGMRLQALMVTENRAQLRVRSGNLINSIQYKLNQTPNGIEVEAGSYGVKYARIHEYGGVIRPRRAQYLRFYIPGVGWRSAKQVTIPARPYIRPAFEKAMPYIEQTIKEHLGVE